MPGISAAREDVSAARPRPRLLAGTMVTTDIDKARVFYETFLGFEAVRHAPDRLMIRDRYAKAAMERGDDDFFVIDVRQVDEITSPQRMLHHWGLSVASREEVDRIHDEAKARKDEFGLTLVNPIAPPTMHLAHSFYFADRDSNWWEVEHRLDDLDNEDFFLRGETTPETEKPRWELSLPPKTARARAEPREEAVVGDAELTHGTTELMDVRASRSFLDEVAHLRTVAHRDGEKGFMFAGPGSLAVVSVRLVAARPQEVQNRWIICVDELGDVEAFRDRAIAARERLGIRSIGDVLQGDYGPSCVVQNGCGNWFETVHCAPEYFRRIFERRDVS